MGQELIEALPGTPVFPALSLRLLAQEEAGASFMPTRLMSRQVTCPLDGKDFDVTVVTAYTVLDRGSDLKPVYAGPSITGLRIWMCPHCGYAAFSDEFAVTLKPEAVTAFKAALAPGFRSWPSYRQIPDLEKTRAAVVCARARGAAADLMGPLFLHGAWIAREQGEVGIERIYLQEAAASLAQAVQEDQTNREKSVLSANDRMIYTYLAGECHRRLGEDEAARTWFEKARRLLHDPPIPGIEGWIDFYIMHHLCYMDLTHRGPTGILARAQRMLPQQGEVIAAALAPHRENPMVKAWLEQALRNGTERTRQAVMGVVVTPPAADFLPLYRAALSDRNPAVVQQAAWAIGVLVDQASLPALLAGLEKAPPSARLNLLRAVSACWDGSPGEVPDAVERLLERLPAIPPTIYDEALYAQALEILAGSDTTHARYLAHCGLLSRLASPAFGYYLPVVRRLGEGVLPGLIWALYPYDEALAGYLPTEFPTDYSPGSFLPIPRGKIELLAMRMNALTAVSAIAGEKAEALLVRLLDDDDSEIGAGAALALARRGDARGVEVAAALLSPPAEVDFDAENTAAALQTLQLVGGADRLPLLRDLLGAAIKQYRARAAISGAWYFLDDRDRAADGVLMTAAALAGVAGREAGIHAHCARSDLIKLLEFPDDRVRAGVVELLEPFYDEEIAQALRRRLPLEGRDFMAATARLIGRVGDRQMMDVLLELGRVPDLSICRAVNEAMEKLQEE